MMASRSCLSTNLRCQLQIPLPSPDRHNSNSKYVTNSVNTLILPQPYLLARALTEPEATARAADDAGFAVTVLEDCCASPNPAWHTFSIDSMLPLFGRVISTEAFLQAG